MRIRERLQRSGYDLPTAERALRALVRNPDDLPQVFTIIDALSGSTPDRLIARLRSTPGGNELLEQSDELMLLLSDREKLRALPEGSLGRAYLAFVEAEGISAEGIFEASVEGRLDIEFSADDERLRILLRDSHDLWHVVTGYHGDLIGELALLSFSAAQTLNPAVIAIVLVGVAKGFARGNLRLVLDAFFRGRSSEWLPAVNWKTKLRLPLDEVRTELKVGAPRSYLPVRSEELRQTGVLARAA